MKIDFYGIEGWEKNIIDPALSGQEIRLHQEAITPLRLPETADAEIVSVFVDSQMNAEVLQRFPKLKMLTTRSTGYDHIDLVECKKRGILVSYVPGYGDNTVAEFAFSLIFNLTRKTYQGIDQIKETGSFSQTGLRGVDLKGKTLGIIGTGRIGKESAKIGKGLGMNLVGYDPFPDEKFAQEIGLRYLILEDLLKTADVITIHAPYNESTRHLINGKNVSLIKPGSYLVNTARGAIVETAALVNALQKGILAGVGLDVLEEEGETKDELSFLTKGHPKLDELKTILSNHILMKMPNVLITPHNAFNTQEALQRILNATLENIKGFMEGKPINLVKN